MSLRYSGLSFDRPKKQRRERCEPDPEEKKKYLDEANEFAMSLVEGLADPDGNNIKVSLLVYSCRNRNQFINKIKLCNPLNYVKLGYVYM